MREEKGHRFPLPHSVGWLFGDGWEKKETSSYPRLMREGKGRKFPLPHLVGWLFAVIWCVECLRKIQAFPCVQCQGSVQGWPIQAPLDTSHRVTEQMVIQRDHNKRSVEWVLWDSGCTSVRVPFPFTSLIYWRGLLLTWTSVDWPNKQQKSHNSSLVWFWFWKTLVPGGTTEQHTRVTPLSCMVRD